VIPRFLDDYRGCIAEVKERGVALLPPDNPQVRLVVRKKRTWQQAVLAYAGTFSFTLAYNARESHAMRVVGLVGCVGYFAWLMLFEDRELEDHGWVRWVGWAALVVMLGWLVRHMAHTW
jgi:hypothetical protein